MKKGKIKFWNDTKGFGFIIEDQTEKETFVHVSGLEGSYKPEKGDVVFYEETEGKKGMNAINVTIA